METLTSYQIFIASTQLIFVGITIFGGIMGINTVFKYSYEDRKFYFPTWKGALNFYLLHSLEIIYVAALFSPQALLFVNAMGLLIPINLTLLVWHRFFFFKETNILIKLDAITPLFALIPLLINVFRPTLFTPHTIHVLYWLVLAIMTLNILLFAIYLSYCQKKVIKQYEMEYSNVSDFPKKFAIQMCSALTIWIVLHLIMFITNDAYVKAYIDIIRSSLGILITLSWIKENRVKKIESTTNQASEEQTNPNLINEKNLLEQLYNLFETKQVFLHPDLRLSDLQSMLGTNRTYLSQAINSIPGQTFYSIVQKYRTSYAKQLLINQPELKLDDIAIQSGFSSRSFFSRSFKENVGCSPSEYRQTHLKQHH